MTTILNKSAAADQTTQIYGGQPFEVVSEKVLKSVGNDWLRLEGHSDARYHCVIGKITNIIAGQQGYTQITFDCIDTNNVAYRGSVSTGSSVTTFIRRELLKD